MGSGKKTLFKTIFAIVIFGVFITTAYFAYGFLSERFGPKPFSLQQNGETNHKTSPAPSGAEDIEDEDRMKAPDFYVYNDKGEKVDFSDFIGKPVIINFWTTWCPYCVDEMADFNEAYMKYKDDVHFLMVNQTDGVRETKKAAEDFVEKEGFKFPIYFDLDFSASYVYGIQYLPTTVFVDSEGFFHSGYAGPINKSTLEKHINELLN